MKGFALGLPLKGERQLGNHLLKALNEYFLYYGVHIVAEQR